MIKIYMITDEIKQGLLRRCMLADEYDEKEEWNG